MTLFFKSWCDKVLLKCCCDKLVVYICLLLKNFASFPKITFSSRYFFRVGVTDLLCGYSSCKDFCDNLVLFGKKKFRVSSYCFDFQMACFSSYWDGRPVLASIFDAWHQTGRGFDSPRRARHLPELTGLVE